MKNGNLKIEILIIIYLQMLVVLEITAWALTNIESINYERNIFENTSKYTSNNILRLRS
jgi:hypothetical protein